MTARDIASHRYGHANEFVSASVAKAELISEYRNLLLGNDTRKLYARYNTLACQLLDCSSAVLLCALEHAGQEIARHDSGEMIGAHLGPLFCREFHGHAELFVDDIADYEQQKFARVLESRGIGSFAGVVVASDNLELAIIVAIETKARRWTTRDIERLRNVSEMLRADLTIARERHQMAVQKRMQRSLVQFVRGNLPKTNLPAVESIKRRGVVTKSLYSDLDEDLQAEDVDDEVDQVETSRMNIMFDFSCQLIRRTLQSAGCVLVNIENLTDLENIEAEFPTRSTIMGACFLKHLRSTEWHHKTSGHGSTGSGSGFHSSVNSTELSSKAVERSDAFDPRGLGGPWLRQLLEAHPRAVSFDEESLPEAMKQLLPAGLQSCLLSPIYDSNAKAFALIIVFNDQKSEFTKADCHYVEAFGSSIYAEVLNQSLQRANEAKSLFISKISHEFRTPLHGILASAEFLNDMPDTTPAQLGFVRTIDTCGRTLLEIINHVLDFSKLSFGNKVLETEPVPQTIALEDFDVVDVAEQVLATAFSSYEFKRINDHLDVQKTNSQRSRSDSDSGSLTETMGRNVEVLLQADHRPQGYVIHSDLGAFRRILLNLLGNALKYTHLGHVILRLSLQADEAVAGLETLQISVNDTGIGIATSFLIEMFKPFSQEDEFSAGTGLGLSIVKELTTKMHGTIDVQTRKHQGSCFTVSYPAIVRASRPTLFPGAGSSRDLQGLKFYYYLDPETDSDNSEGASTLLRSSTISHLVNWFGMTLVEAQNADVIITDDTMEHNFPGPILTFCSTTAKYERHRTRRSRPLQFLLTKPFGPLKLGEAMSQCLALSSSISRLQSDTAATGPHISMNSQEVRHASPDGHDESSAASISSTVRNTSNTSNITGGSRRTIKDEQNADNLEELYNLHLGAKARRDSLVRTRTSSNPRPSMFPRTASTRSRRTESIDFTQSDEPDADAGSVSGEGKSNSQVIKSSVPEHVAMSRPEAASEILSSDNIDSDDDSDKKKHVLIVEDNPINMMLLVAFAKQHRLTATTAANGQIAYERVRGRARNYDAILMDINMPVCNGFEAMQMIRDFEVENDRSRSRMAALTGLSTGEDRAKAAKRGADAFFTKPVKMKELRTLLETWEVILPDPAAADDEGPNGKV